MHTTQLTKVGNSTAIIIPRDVLTEVRLDRGDEVTLLVRDGRIEIVKCNDDCSKAMGAGRAFSTRYRRAMAVLAK
ncbi:AbrB/MazE/SpoVT family DNA-binding domain-containing protein [Nitrospirillum amazonense]|uniref:AbrB/MazE/SpoVT family DNA-binding domain-containing protein n=1 Tax=Nitrospirillum amazonense TaxID=28077 RepID=UPI0024122EA4|nr:AbrB/MazE/SpoVT family DNA-binding domain-containing protein [Nitrospirillum amazonense]MDG3441744.1 AbrB/MazE/SpoVT family DNA-binding domain-containing protein [Nitrospirillum amazonense]